MKRILFAFISSISIITVGLAIYALKSENDDLKNDINSINETIKTRISKENDFENSFVNFQNEHSVTIQQLTSNIEKERDSQIKNSKTLENLSNIIEKNYTEINQRNSKYAFTAADYAIHIDVIILADGMIRTDNGSGTLIRAEDGELYIITNYHVAHSAPNEMMLGIFARLNQSNAFPHPVILFSWSEAFDIAILKFTDKFEYNGKVATLGNSSDLVTGSPVISIGSSFGLPFTCKSGIISNTRRLGIWNNDLGIDFSIPEVIMHTADIAPGNSGGPLISINDDSVVGINYMIATKTTGRFSIYFHLAIPSEDLKIMIPKMIKSGGEIEHGWLEGIRLMDSSKIPTAGLPGEHRRAREGAMIIGVASGAFTEPQPKVGDLILSCNGASVNSPIDVIREAMHSAPDSKINLTVDRDGKNINLVLKLINFKNRNK